MVGSHDGNNTKRLYNLCTSILEIIYVILLSKFISVYIGNKPQRAILYSYLCFEYRNERIFVCYFFLQILKLFGDLSLYKDSFQFSHMDLIRFIRKKK